MAHYPMCFEGGWQFEAWRKAALACLPKLRRAGDPGKPVNYCTDCTPEFQREMLAEKRCCRPETKFYGVLDGDEIEVYGVR